jgi:DNA processing protein
MKDILLFFTIKYNGNWNKIYSALEAKEKVFIEDVVKESQSTKENFVTIMDESYPENFKQANKPPFVIFYRGELDLLNDKCIYIDGPINEKDYEYLEKETIICSWNVYTNIKVRKISKIVIFLEYIEEVNAKDFSVENIENYLIFSERTKIDKLYDQTRTWSLCSSLSSGIVFINRHITTQEFEKIEAWVNNGKPIYIQQNKKDTIESELINSGAIPFRKISEIFD